MIFCMTSHEFQKQEKKIGRRRESICSCSYAGLTFDWAKKFKPNFDRYARMWVPMGRRVTFPVLSWFQDFVIMICE